MSQAHSLLDVDAVLSLAVRLRAVAERLRVAASTGAAERGRWDDEVVRISQLGSVDPARAAARMTTLEQQIDAALGPTPDDRR